MLNLDKIDRSRQDSIWVKGEEYNIFTLYPYWLSFEKKLENINENTSYEEFDYLYKLIIPENKQAGFEELYKFYLNKQILPKDTGESSNIKVLDWNIDSEYIYAAFMTQYQINLICDDLHHHDFISLFNSLKGHKINEIIEARLWTKPVEYKDLKKHKEAENKLHEQRREMWSLESKEINKIFEMK